MARTGGKPARPGKPKSNPGRTKRGIRAPEARVPWADAAENISKRQRECDAAVRRLQDELAKLNVAIGGAKKLAPDESKALLEPPYRDVLQAWTELQNAADRLAAYGLGLSKDYPDQAKVLVTGTVQELTVNLLDASAALRLLAEQIPAEDPLKLVAGQPNAYAFAQEFLATMLPGDAGWYRRRFEELGLPVAGFAQHPIVVAGAEEAPEPDADQPISILHISDLHRTRDELVGNGEVSRDLLDGIGRLDTKQLDLLIVSGDLSQSATHEEYLESERLLAELVDRLVRGDRKRCIVVPGNHDINWPASEAGSFRVQAPGRVPGDAIGRVPIGNFVAYPQTATLAAAKKPFEDSYKRFFGEEYQPFRFVEPPGTVGLGIVAIDTTRGMHHLNDIPDVDRDLLGKCLEDARRKAGRLIAVGHHGPASDAAQKDAVASWVLERLRAAGVELYLHGHVHQTSVSYFAPHIAGVVGVGVGSLVAGPKQRPESTPRQYHVVELPRSGKRRVFVRRKDRRDSPWERDTRFAQRAGPPDCLVL